MKELRKDQFTIQFDHGVLVLRWTYSRFRALLCLFFSGACRVQTVTKWQDANFLIEIILGEARDFVKSPIRGG